MELFIKYKHKNDTYKKGQGFYDTELMYYHNGHCYKRLHGWIDLLHCMRQNYPIVVLYEPPELIEGLDEDVASKINFVLNPSEIAKIFSVDNARRRNKEEKKEREGD